MHITYTVGDNGDDIYKLETKWDENHINYMADEAADDFHKNHDGWESNWPLDIEIYINNNSQGVYRVELEISPTFSSTKLTTE